MTLYFSHPEVEGVMLWGFWDGKIYEQSTALYEGPNVTVSLLLLLFKVISRCINIVFVNSSCLYNINFNIEFYNDTHFRYKALHKNMRYKQKNS